MISDTGISITMGLHTAMDHASGAERWVAIQTIVPGNTDPESPGTLTYECDIWSLGMLIYVCVILDLTCVKWIPWTNNPIIGTFHRRCALR